MPRSNYDNGAYGRNAEYYMGDQFEYGGPKHWNNKTIIEWVDAVRKANHITAEGQTPLLCHDGEMLKPERDDDSDATYQPSHIV